MQFDAASGMAELAHEGRAQVDVQLCGAVPFVVGSWYQVIGEPAETVPVRMMPDEACINPFGHDRKA